MEPLIVMAGYKCSVKVKLVSEVIAMLCLNSELRLGK